MSFLIYFFITLVIFVVLFFVVIFLFVTASQEQIDAGEFWINYEIDPKDPFSKFDKTIKDQIKKYYEE